MRVHFVGPSGLYTYKYEPRRCRVQPTSHRAQHETLRSSRAAIPIVAGMTFERITIDPTKMRGTPCIRGLRIPVATVIGQLAARRSVDEILDDYPDLEDADIQAALEYAAAAVRELRLPD